MRNKILAILIFLIAGLYIDVRMMRKDESICVKGYSQRTLNVQVIIPFRPERETFYFGVGNRHYDHVVEFTHFVDEETGKLLGTNKEEYGCVPRYEWLKEQGASSFLRHYTHYFNLNRNPIQEMGRVKVKHDIREETKEDYERWYK